MPTMKDFNMDGDSFFADVLSETVTNAKEVSKLFPDVLDMQKAILEGLSDSFERESVRLKDKYSKENSRTREMDGLVEDLKVFKDETFSGLEFVKHSAQTIYKDNTFHGYVYDSKGRPAKNHKVILKFQNKKIKNILLSAKVDSSGYFYIDLEKQSDDVNYSNIFGKSSKEKRIDDIKSIFDKEGDDLGGKLMDFLRREKINEEKRKASTNTDKEKARGERVEDYNQEEYIEMDSDIQIENEKGKVVLRDDNPPVFEPPKSVFKRYQITKTK